MTMHEHLLLSPPRDRPTLPSPQEFLWELALLPCSRLLRCRSVDNVSLRDCCASPITLLPLRTAPKHSLFRIAARGRNSSPLGRFPGRQVQREPSSVMFFLPAPKVAALSDEKRKAWSPPRTPTVSLQSQHDSAHQKGLTHGPLEDSTVRWNLVVQLTSPLLSQCICRGPHFYQNDRLVSEFQSANHGSERYLRDSRSNSLTAANVSHLPCPLQKQRLTQSASSL